MNIQHPFYPIIYVRGYAATMSEIEETSATPYMGFNLGSTKIRQDYQGKIVRFIFESPLIRLMKDEGYVDTYKDGDYVADEPAPAKSIWIFRYYERVSKDLGLGQRASIYQFAEDLREFVLRVRKQICGSDKKALKKFKVYLVAHSMGGLVCRAYIQNICVSGTGNKNRDAELELPGDHLVDKVFTYATPHNGIDVLGLNVPNLGGFDEVDVKNFNRNYMKEYLKLPPNAESVNSLNGTFPPEKFFCLVGTNYRDYSAFFGLSKKATGPMSDGLVMIQNASVKDAPRAYIHRSHSGQYGIVNSEEGYQNLKRFLFGQVKVDIHLQVDEITLPAPIQKLKDNGKKIRASYCIETTGQVRGANYFLNERKESHASAMLRGYDDMVKLNKPVYLFSGYLDRRSKTENSGDTALAFAVRLAIAVPLYEVDNKFWFDNYFPGGYIINEAITFNVRFLKNKFSSIKYNLASDAGMGEANISPKIDKLKNGSLQIHIPLGFKEGEANPPRPGFRGCLHLTTSHWNVT
jgi:hypothetical protein